MALRDRDVHSEKVFVTYFTTTSPPRLSVKRGPRRTSGREHHVPEQNMELLSAGAGVIRPSQPAQTIRRHGQQTQKLVPLAEQYPDTLPTDVSDKSRLAQVMTYRQSGGST